MCASVGERSICAVFRHFWLIAETPALQFTALDTAEHPISRRNPRHFAAVAAGRGVVAATLHQARYSLQIPLQRQQHSRMNRR